MATDFTLRSWVPVDSNSDFPIQNLPYGIFKPGKQSPRAGVAIGTKVLDISALMELGFFDVLALTDPSVFHADVLNDFIALGKEQTAAVRKSLTDLLLEGNTVLQNFSGLEKILHEQRDVVMLMPIRVGDYTDFYSSEQHAYNVGVMFRDPSNALLPNWKHLPVGYHGRASSIVVSGTHLHRPTGQTRPDDQLPPVFGPSKQVDFELEVAFVVGKESPLGSRISTTNAEEFIFGMVLFNDWSARDMQKWEYVPLGPFLAKNFGSSISPWIVPMEALQPFRVAGPEQVPRVLPYLQYTGMHHYDLSLEVSLHTPSEESTILSRSNYKYMYWNMVQQLAHHTVNGCNVRIGDLMASGTISGPTPDSYGSMLELSWKGTKPVELSGGGRRTFIEDGDTVIMRGFGMHQGVRIGFGEVRTTMLPPVQ
jgi:fumarylacetoacetase